MNKAVRGVHGEQKGLSISKVTKNWTVNIVTFMLILKHLLHIGIQFWYQLTILMFS